jgi:serine/threonine-protein kinase
MIDPESFSQATRPYADPDISRSLLAEDHRSGERFGRYLLLEKIGQGGMGVVFKALQEPLNRLVALKMILAGAYARPKDVARFRGEGEAIARIRHPNVVQIYEADEQNGRPFLSMEFMEGGSLAKQLNGTPQPPTQAAALVEALARGVHEAHQHNIVHRDLKPANVLLAADGTPKITDFGLAKFLDASEGHTESEAILGTAKYMAPEQAWGKSKQIGPLADVYALGTILYEMLCGIPPFAGTTLIETLEMVRSREPVPPSYLQKDVPPGLEAICLKCLEKQPAHRYATARDLADDLSKWLRGEQPLVKPSHWLGRLWRWASRRPASLIVGAGVVLAVLIGWIAIHLRTPHRPIEEIEARLADGRPVTLIPDTGEPGRSRWAFGGSGAKGAPGTDGTFTINTWTLSMLELLRDPQKERYRFLAEVRHLTSDESGELGLYFAAGKHAGGAGPLHFFCQLAFNDIRDIREFHAQAERITGKPILPRPSGNPIFFLPRFCARGEKGLLWDPRLSGPQTPVRSFIPAGFGGGQWRRLIVEVTPATVRAWWGEQKKSNGWKMKSAGEWEVPQLAKAIDKEVAERTKRPRGRYFLKGTSPAFSCRGSLGLYVFRGSASFRNVKVEPFDDAR